MNARRLLSLRPFQRNLLCGALGLAAMPLLTSSAWARTITVNTVAEDDVANGNCTVREAVRAVNTRVQVDQCPSGDGANDTILLPSGTINLTSELAITANTVMRGNGIRRTYFNGGRRSIFAFQVGDRDGVSSPTFTLTGVRITAFQNGGVFARKRSILNLSYAAIYDTGTTAGTLGGAIRNNGTAMISDVEIARATSSRGGGIFNSGSMSLLRANIHDCDGEHGGAILNAGGHLRVYASTLHNNHVTVRGAAIDNTTGDGIAGSAFLHGVTIVNNATDGSFCSNNCGAITQLAGTLQMIGSLVAQNKKAGGAAMGANCSGDIKSLGYNLMGESAALQCAPLASGDFVGDPRLSTLTPIDGGHFGMGNIFIPAAGSVALNRIPVGSPGCSASDQRGISRQRDFGSCDVGAVERAGASLVVGDANILTAGDDAIRTQLTKLGFSVTLFDDNNINGGEGAGNALVVISESVGSGNVASKYQTARLGVVVMEPFIYDDMLMTNSVQDTHFGTMAGQTQIVAASNSGFRMLGMLGSAGTLNASHIARSYGFGVPAGGGLTLATFPSNSTRASVFAFPTATTMAAGFIAPAPRVGVFPMGEVPAELFGDGYLLVNQAFLFAAGD